MMTKKDYEKAARIVRERVEAEDYPESRRGERIECDKAVMFAFVALFKGDNPAFDQARFIDACRKDR